MNGGTLPDRMSRVEDHLKAQDSLLKALDDKIDVLIRMQIVQDEKINKMAPTVEAGDAVFKTARTLTGFARWTLWAATGLVAFLVYMQDRWALVGQFFRRAG